jgi:murein DD-endopeptidase MepM/ murein hydrolase activator NlpD
MRFVNRSVVWVFVAISIAALPLPKMLAPALYATAAAPASKEGTAEVTWQPTNVVNGAPIFVQVKWRKPLRSLHATWLSHDVPFVYDEASKTWSALAGVSLKTKAGSYPIEFAGENATGQAVTFARTIRVQSAHYRTVALTVARKFTEPSPADLEAIKQAEALKKDVFEKVTPQREWSGAFHPPITLTDVRISDQFGTARKFNGKVQSVHQGLDYAVPQGTPIVATNEGTVVLAEPLFFEGNCVMIDHGQGLLTLYMHLSELKVKAGDHVERGQQIGLSGATGRATGAHLHIAVRWQGTYLDPATLFSLKLPAQ